MTKRKKKQSAEPPSTYTMYPPTLQRDNPSEIQYPLIKNWFTPDFTKKKKKIDLSKNPKKKTKLQSKEFNQRNYIKQKRRNQAMPGFSFSLLLRHVFSAARRKRRARGSIDGFFSVAKYQVSLRPSACSVDPRAFSFFFRYVRATSYLPATYPSLPTFCTLEK